MKTTNTPADNKTGKMIRNLRLKKGWSQGELGKLLAISTPAVSKIEAGLTTVNTRRLKQLADVFGITVRHFLIPDSPLTDLNGIEQVRYLKERIAVMDSELLSLQQVAIKLYEELSQKRKAKKK